MELYVCNLPYEVDEHELETVFSRVGTVQAASVIRDRQTNRSRGFGFVTMEPGAARAALRELNGVEVGGRPLRITEAKPRGRTSPPAESRPPSRPSPPQPRPAVRSRPSEPDQPPWDVDRLLDDDEDETSPGREDDEKSRLRRKRGRERAGKQRNRDESRFFEDGGQRGLRRQKRRRSSSDDDLDEF